MKLVIPAVLMLLAPVLTAQGVIGLEYTIVDTCFRMADANKDGKITAEEARKLRNQYLKEMKEACAIKAEMAREEKLQAVGIKYDETSYVITPYVFAALDANSDHKLTKAELRVAEESDYQDISDEKRMAWVFEQEWQIALDAFGGEKSRLIDSAMLKDMARQGDYRNAIEELAENLYVTLSEKLCDFEDQLMKEQIEAEGEDSGIEEKDLSRVTVEKKQFLKDAEAAWKKGIEDARRAQDPAEIKKAEEARKAAEEARKADAEKLAKRKEDLEKRKAERAKKDAEEK